MYQIYEHIPFGVMILKGSTLIVEYFNTKLKKMLNLQEGANAGHALTLCFLKIYEKTILECYDSKKEVILNQVEIFENRFFTITINPKEARVELYFQETTEEVVENRKIIYDKEEKLEKEKQRFLNISTELKTKCDIIEILRDREKEHLMHLKDVINNISEGLIVIDNRGKLSLCNRAAYAITELNAGEIINEKAVSEMYNIYKEDNDEFSVDNFFGNMFKKNIPVKNSIVRFAKRKDNTSKYIEVNSNPIFNMAGEILYTIVTLKDVTKAKLHQINAEEQASFVRDVVNTLDVPVAVIDYPELTYKLINKKYKNFIGNTEKNEPDFNEILGQPVKNFSGNFIDKNIYNLLCKVGDTEKEYSTSIYSIIDENSNKRFYKFKYLPYKDLSGKVSRIHLHGLDITEEVNHNNELEKITRLKDEFFTVISHELRTPLTIIYSSLQLANDIYKDEITFNIDKTLKRIEQNCSRLLKLINNILDLSKAEAGFLTVNNSNFDIVYITENIISSVNLYAKSKNIELIFDTNVEENIVYLDKEKYERVLLNLLSNAIKFTPDNKRILVIIDVEWDFITLKVKDEGIGIPHSKLDYIFDRFAQVNTSLSRRAEGTGIGLSLVKELVKYMNGEIFVSSDEGNGSEFTIKFNKIELQPDMPSEILTLDTTLNDKIDIEFSDIN